MATLVYNLAIMSLFQEVIMTNSLRFCSAPPIPTLPLLPAKSPIWSSLSYKILIFLMLNADLLNPALEVCILCGGIKKIALIDLAVMISFHFGINTLCQFLFGSGLFSLSLSTRLSWNMEKSRPDWPCLLLLRDRNRQT